MIQLADRASSHDNNFTLIRLAAAFFVLVSHSFALSTGRPEEEPLTALLGFSLGTVAVDIFFSVSGFLVTGSLCRRGDPYIYFRSRVLRIYPGLFVMIVITVLLIGPAITRLDFTEYFLSPETGRYFLRCATLIFGVSYVLPGVFEANPYPQAVNGSLWSMPYELRMYLVLLLMWLLAQKCSRGTKRADVFGAVVTLAAGVAWVIFVIGQWQHWSTKWPKLAVEFFAGAFLYIFRARIEPSLANFALSSCSLIAVRVLISQSAMLALYVLVLPYLIFCIAYAPVGPLKAVREIDDISYGVYIYAFPVQQLVVCLIPGIGALGLTVYSLAIVVPLAIVSWYIVERPALALK